MASFLKIITAFVLIVIWIAAGVYSTQANIYLTEYKDDDRDFRDAYDYTFWIAFITWFLVGLVIVLIVLAIFGVVGLFATGVGEAGVAAEGVETSEGLEIYQKKPPGTSVLSIVFLAVSLSLVITTGVLSVLAARALRRSAKYDENNGTLTEIYHDTIISASLSIGSAGILFVGVLTYFIVGLIRTQRRKSREEEQIRTIKKLQLLSLAETRS